MEWLKSRQSASGSSQTAPQGTKAQPTQGKRGKRNWGNFSTAFWDMLSEVTVSVRALRELDRRDDCQPFKRQTLHQPGYLSQDICRFARLGGPSLEHLRGYKPPIVRSSASNMPRRKKPTPTDAQPKTTRTITPYDANFQRILSLGGVHESDYETRTFFPVVPTNFEAIKGALLADRADPPTAMDYRRFKRALKNATESKVTGLFLKWLTFDTDASYAQGTPFSNLSQIVIPEENLRLSDARPDYYEGSPLQDINKKIRQDLASVILPTDHDPALPNFFLEFKSLSGSRPVAERQIVYDGALGARAIDSLHNYNRKERVDDGKSRVLGFTFDGKTLQAYTHHVEPSPSPSNPLHIEHFTAEIDAWCLTGNLKSFAQGINALKNGREMAEKWRREVIKDAEDRLGLGDQR